MEIHKDPHAFKATASLHRSGKPDLLNQIVKLFKSESPTSIAALQHGMDLAELNARIAELTLPVSTPA